MPNLTPENCRAARALLGWSTHDLAERAGVGRATLARFESGEAIRDDSKEKIVAAIDVAGVQIFNGKRPGARVK